MPRGGTRSRRRRRLRPLRRLAAVPLALALGCGAPATAPEEDLRLGLLVTVDTLRADRLGAFGSERGLTPRLDGLASESVVFETAYAPAPFTLPSIAALLTGRYPETVGVVANDAALDDAVPTLAEALRERGFRTAAVVASAVLRRASGLDAGFEIYDDELPERRGRLHWPERVAAATTDAALRALDRCAGGDAPCFLWVHYQDPHGPYLPPPGLRERYLEAERRAPGGRRRLPVGSDHGGRGALPVYQVVGEEREVAFYRAGYDAEIAYLDEEVGRLVDALRERGLWDASAIAFTADHGEALGERGYWFAHGHDLSEALVRVPLLVRAPGLRPGRRSDPVSLVDVFPTLLSLLAEAPAGRELRGRDLFGAPDAESVPYLATLDPRAREQHALVTPDRMLVVRRSPQGPRARLVDPRTGRDLTRKEPERTQALARRLRELRSELGPPREVRRRLSDEERRALGALGYLTDGETGEDAPPAPPGSEPGAR